MPLFEDGHGGSVQIELRPLQQLSLLGAVDFGKDSGYYGRQSPYTITYTDHDRNNTCVRAALTYTTATAMHRLDVRYANEKLANRNAVYRELTNASGAYYYEYYDPVETADKQWQDSRVAYTASPTSVTSVCRPMRLLLEPRAICCVATAFGRSA